MRETAGGPCGLVQWTKIKERNCWWGGGGLLVFNQLSTEYRS